MFFWVITYIGKEHKKNAFFMEKKCQYLWITALISFESMAFILNGMWAWFYLLCKLGSKIIAFAFYFIFILFLRFLIYFFFCNWCCCCCFLLIIQCWTQFIFLKLGTNIQHCRPCKNAARNIRAFNVLYRSVVVVFFFEWT